MKLLLLFLVSFVFLKAETPTKESVTKLYVATFSRAPDADGLSYWLNSSGLTLEGIASSFFDQDEAKEKYPAGSSNFTFIDSVYRNLFNRSSDQSGFNYWYNELNTGSISKSNFILAVVNGAQNSDAVILSNKTDVGLSFADAGFTNTQDAINIMRGITSDTNSVTSALTSYGLSLPSSATDYEFVVIYKNIDINIAATLQESYSSYKNYNFTNENISKSCTDYGFTNLTSSSSSNGVVNKSYIDGKKSCIESDYSSSLSNGNSNLVQFYDIN